jgi:exosome complex component MTR3
LLPKSTVDVFLLVLESDTVAGILSAGLTVASAAVADAGISMGGLGVGSVISQQDGERLVDPSKDEEQTSDGCITVGVMPALNKLTNLWLSGELDVDDACQVSHN